MQAPRHLWLITALCCLAWGSIASLALEAADVDARVQVDTRQVDDEACTVVCEEGYQWALLHGVTLDNECRVAGQPEEFRRGCRLFLKDLGSDPTE
jgi:hypothetical protein